MRKKINFIRPLISRAKLQRKLWNNRSYANYAKTNLNVKSVKENKSRKKENSRLFEHKAYSIIGILLIFILFLKGFIENFFLFPFKMEVSEVLKIIAVKLAAKETKGELVRPPKAASLFFKVWLLNMASAMLSYRDFREKGPWFESYLSSRYRKTLFWQSSSSSRKGS